MTASSRVGELFQKRGVTTLANDTAVHIALSMLGVFAALIYVVVAFCLALLLTVSSVVETKAWWGVSGPLVISIFVYVAVMVTVLEVVRSSFKAVFVCFVQVSVLSVSN